MWLIPGICKAPEREREKERDVIKIKYSGELSNFSFLVSPFLSIFLRSLGVFNAAYDSLRRSFESISYDLALTS